MLREVEGLHKRPEGNRTSRDTHVKSSSCPARGWPTGATSDAATKRQGGFCPTGDEAIMHIRAYLLRNNVIGMMPRRESETLIRFLRSGGVRYHGWHTCVWLARGGIAMQREVPLLPSPAPALLLALYVSGESSNASSELRRPYVSLPGYGWQGSGRAMSVIAMVAFLARLKSHANNNSGTVSML